MVRVNRRGYCQAYSVVRAARGGWRFRRYYLNNNRRISAAPPSFGRGGRRLPPGLAWALTAAVLVCVAVVCVRPSGALAALEFNCLHDFKRSQQTI